MSTDLVGLNYASNTTTTASGLLNGTGTTSGTSSTSSLNAGGLSIQGDGGDEKKFSQGAEMMQKLKDLQSSDPDKFKEVAQTISDKLTEAAKNSTDSKASGMLTKMADKFASAAKSGDMSALTPAEAPAGAAGANGQAAMKYAKSSGSNPMEQLDSAISSALSGVDSTSA
uniref:Uncharacterized protein n=1 Tax=Desulfovibrio sp. U5L TaxID=596152 RepID=I2Q3X1_9BACT